MAIEWKDKWLNKLKSKESFELIKKKRTDSISQKFWSVTILAHTEKACLNFVQKWGWKTPFNYSIKASSVDFIVMSRCNDFS